MRLHPILHKYAINAPTAQPSKTINVSLSAAMGGRRMDNACSALTHVKNVIKRMQMVVIFIVRSAPINFICSAQIITM